MYVCPHCHEEIPDRVRRTQSECPFCREPWPPEETAPAEPEPAAQQSQPQSHASPAQGAATAAAPSATSEPYVEAAEPEKKGKGLVIVLVVVLVAAAAGGVWWWKHKGGSTQGGKAITVNVGGEKVVLKDYVEDDYAQTLAWYEGIRKLIVGFFAEKCEPYQRHRFHVTSRLVEREKLISAKKKIKNLQLDVTIDSKAKAKPDGFDWLTCPYIMAFVHKEHAMTIQMEMTEKERVLGSTLRRAIITIEGGRFVQGKGTYRSSWDNNRAGLFFPGLSKTDAKKHPGVMALNGKKSQAKPPKKFILGGIEFVRQEKLQGKAYLAGRWVAHIETDKFIKLFRDWTGRCRALKKSIKETNDQYPDKAMKVPALKEEAAAATRKLCRGLATIAEGLEPWDEAKVRQGADLIKKAQQILENNIRTPLLDLGKAVGSSTKPKPLCGSPSAPTECTKK